MTRPTRRRSAFAVPHFLVTLLLAGCGDSPEAGAASADEIVEWTLEEVGTIGSENDPETSFSRVEGVRIGTEGELFVGQPNQLWVYGADGKLLRRIGRQGQGPGEFTSMTGWGFLGDTLYAVDLDLRRVSYFTPSGDFIDSRQWERWPEIPTGENRSLLIDMPQVLLPDGSGLVTPGTAGRAGSRPPRGPQTTSSPRAIFRIRSGVAALDTVFWRDVSSTSNSAAVEGGSFVRVSCPFSDAPIVQPMINGGGVMVVERSPASAAQAHVPFTLLSPSGDTVFSVSLPYDPVPVDEQQVARRIESARSLFSRLNRPAPSAADVESALREIDCFPATLPPVRLITSTQDGTIWLQWEDGTDTPITWDAIGPNGDRMGRIRLRPGEMVAAAEGDVLVTTWTDALEVPYVTRYRLTR
jgi:hypothetical protein